MKNVGEALRLAERADEGEFYRDLHPDEEGAG